MANQFSYLTDPLEVPDAPDSQPVQPDFAPTPAPTWGFPMLDGFNPTDQGYWTDDNAQTSQLAAAALVPWYQAQQGASQWGLEFNEATRRWENTNAWAQQSDQFNMALAAQQQALAGWSATTQANQWEQQFAAQGVNDEVARQIALRQQKEAEAQGGFSRDQALWQRGLATDQLGLERRAAALAENKWLGTQDLQKKQFAEQQRSNLVAEQMAQRQIALQEATEGRKLDLNERKMILDTELARAQLTQREAEMKANLEAARIGAFGRSSGASPTRLNFWG